VRFIGVRQVDGDVADREFWDIGEAVHRYFDRIFEGGLFYLCGPRAKEDAPRPPGDISP
jgi:hypothetical protein